MNLKRLFLLTLAVSLLFVQTALAQDYTPRPGVLSPEQVDFGGKTVTILVGDLGYTGPNGGFPSEDRIAEAEALFNVKIATQSLGTSGVADTITARILAGDSTLDIIRMPHRYGYYSLVSANMLLPISDILPAEYYEKLPNADRFCIEKLQYQNKFYGFGIVYGLFNSTMMFTFYNRDIIEREGLPDPYDLYLAGEWSLDAMTELAMAATRDLTGDGVPDQFGIEEGSISHSNRVFRIAGANGAELAKPDSDGKWVFAYDQPEALEILSIIAKWRYDLKVAGGSLNGGTALFNTHNHLAGARNYTINWGMVPIPSSVPGVYRYPVFDFAMNMLPVNSAYPEGLIALTEFLFREEDGYDYLEYYINAYMKDEKHFRVYEAGIENWQGEGDPFQDMFWSQAQAAIHSVIQGTKGAAQAMDEIAPAIQALLDDLFKQ